MAKTLRGIVFAIGLFCEWAVLTVICSKALGLIFTKQPDLPSFIGLCFLVVIAISAGLCVPKYMELFENPKHVGYLKALRIGFFSLYEFLTKDKENLLGHVLWVFFWIFTGVGLVLVMILLGYDVIYRNNGANTEQLPINWTLATIMGVLTLGVWIVSYFYAAGNDAVYINWDDHIPWLMLPIIAVLVWSQKRSDAKEMSLEVEDKD